MSGGVFHEAARVFRFGLVGALNTLVAYLVFALLLFAGIHYTIATLAGGVAGMLVGFELMSSWVFRLRDRRRLWRFALLFVTAYGLNVGIQTLLLDHSRLNGYWAGAVATALTAIFSYSANRGWVFSPPRNPRRP